MADGQGETAWWQPPPGSRTRGRKVKSCASTGCPAQAEGLDLQGQVSHVGTCPHGSEEIERLRCNEPAGRR